MAFLPQEILMTQSTRRSLLVASTLSLIAFGAALPTGCASDSSTTTSSSTSAETTMAQRASIDSAANAAIARIRAEDPGISKFFDSSVGYAVFPRITTGALIVGASNGDGVLFEGGRVVGDARVSSGSIGAQIGGQTFSQIIFFQTAGELARFKESRMEFDARASAVAVRAGASAGADYARGVAVFTFGEKGLMAAAAIGGQGFRYTAR